MNDELSVGRGPVIHIAQPPADTQHLGRKSGFLQCPAGDVHLVNTLVAQIAIARLPHPVPIVVEASAHERIQRGRATPQIVVYGGRRSLRAADLANGSATLVAKSAGQLDPAQLPCMQIRHGLAHSRIAAGLGAGLHDALVLAGGFNNPATFGDIVADWFFNVNVLAGLDSPDGDESVPVVGGGNGNSIHVGISQQLPDIRVFSDRFVAIAELFSLTLKHRFVHVAQSHDPDTIDAAQAINVTFALAIEADNRHAHVGIGTCGLSPDGASGQQ